MVSKKGIFDVKSFVDSKEALILLLLFACILIFNDMSKPGLASYDDCYYAQKSWEMLQGGDLITPHYNQRKNFYNPPLFFWLLAISITIFGKTAFAVKFFPALSGFLTVWITYLIGKESKDRQTGWWAAFFLSTSYIFLKSARRAMMDVPFLMFCSVSLLFFLRGYRRSPSKASEANRLDINFLLFGFFAGLAGMIKTVFIIFPLGIPVLFLVSKKEWRLLFNKFFLLGLLTGVAVFGWWPAYELLTYGQEFLDGFYHDLLSGRMVSDSGGHGVLGYLVEFGKHFWLWLPLTLWALFISVRRRKILTDPILRLHFLFGFFPILFLSFFSEKPIRYVLFTFPPILVFSALIFKEASPAERLQKFFVWGLSLLFLVSSYLIVKPIDFSKIRNRDYIMLGKLIEKGGIPVSQPKFYHFKGEFWRNHNPMLYYTGFSLSGVLERSTDFREFLKQAGNQVYLLVLKQDAERLLSEHENMRLIFELEDRLLFKFTQKEDLTGTRKPEL